jgi:prepilin peptidase CpaA
MSWTIGNGVQSLAAFICILLLVAAAIGDVRHYRISNRLVGAVVICFVAYAAARASWIFLAWSVAAAACTFAVVAALFAFGLFGGGDTKLTAAMALWVQFADLPRFLIVMTACGGLLGVVWVIRRHLQRRQAAAAGASAPALASENAGAQRQLGVPNKLPYGVAIAMAGIDFFLLSANSPLAGVLSGQ